MADDTSDTPDTGTDDGKAAPAADEPKLGDGGQAALKAERRARAEAERARREAEAELQKLRDKDLSEQERLQRDAAAAAQRADQAEAEAARLRVAITVGLPADLVDRLRGDTPEELEADAKFLKEKFGTPAPAGDPAPSGPRPVVLRPDPGQGAKPTTPRGSFDEGAARARAKFAAQQPGGTAA